MSKPGWKRLVEGASWGRDDGGYPIAAYSEYMPAPRRGPRPYGVDDHFFLDEDPWGWPVTEYDEAYQLRPGLELIARQVVGTLARLGRGEPAQGISQRKLAGNLYWPDELAARAGHLRHERYVVLLPLALSLSQDDKGRVRWTLFGGSEQGPARGFWRSFYTAPDKEAPTEVAQAFIRRLLGVVYGEAEGKPADLRRAGFRVMPDDEPVLPLWREGPLPGWTRPYLLKDRQPVRGVKYLLTFRPFGRLPAAVRRAYLGGELHLIPFPGSMVFWGARDYLVLHRALPFALQIPLLHSVDRHEDPRGVRVPQSGWLHEPRPGEPTPAEPRAPLRNTYKRHHRQARVHRHEDELAVVGREDKLAHVLFSTASADLGLYNKPMARNVQLWTEDYALLLDGPRATPAEINTAADALREGGQFGYRFQFPAVRVGRHEVYWHRPLVAYHPPTADAPVVLADAPAGYFTAYRVDRPDLARPVELWPRFQQRPAHVAAVQLFEHSQGARSRRITRNVRNLLGAWELFGRRPLPRPFAASLLALAKEETLEAWLASLPRRADDPKRGAALVAELEECLEPPGRERPAAALTFDVTARRSFEVKYWRTIARLSQGRFHNKDNADTVTDAATQETLRLLRRGRQRHLEALGDYLLSYYTRLFAKFGMTDKALAGELPFQWRTDFDFPLFGGWQANCDKATHERDLLVVIPGRDRRQAVIMGDHYDTAFMADHFEKEYGGNGARLAARGADDNCSATAALMLGAEAFLKLSREGKLGCDVRLVHLTGEEFPADCMGARHLCQELVEGGPTLRLPDGRRRQLARTTVRGVYVLDMVAHNNDRDRDTFQTLPGVGRESLWLAYLAHTANADWNALAVGWNQRPERRGRGPGRRSPDAAVVPEIARHPRLWGEVRPPLDPRSTLYNTDGQIFSDAGVPVVLYMENYDINRSGYHDSADTMENIDLDYGAAVAATAIESVARAAAVEPMDFGGVEGLRTRKT